MCKAFLSILLEVIIFFSPNVFAGVSLTPLCQPLSFAACGKACPSWKAQFRIAIHICLMCVEGCSVVAFCIWKLIKAHLFPLATFKVCGLNCVLRLNPSVCVLRLSGRSHTATNCLAMMLSWLPLTPARANVNVVIGTFVDSPSQAFTLRYEEPNHLESKWA